MDFPGVTKEIASEFFRAKNNMKCPWGSKKKSRGIPPWSLN